MLQIITGLILSAVTTVAIFGLLHQSRKDDAPLLLRDLGRYAGKRSESAPSVRNIY